LFLPFAKHVVQDQKQFWMYPFHPKRGDAKYFLPFAAFTGALIASDSWMSKQVPDSPRQLKRSRQVSDYALFTLIGGAGSAFVWGHMTSNLHLRETGLLAGEAVIDSTAATYAFKAFAQRSRPLDSQGTAGFFRGGDSFPSEHASAAWAAASVLAHEYPGPLTKFLAYGLASSVTVSRVTAEKHFPSDVVVGSALGWYLGRQVYRSHHNPNLGPWGWESPQSDTPQHEDRKVSTSRGSPSVPIDSWVYPAFERLAAWGYIHTQMLGMRPWTRRECARLLEEAEDSGPSDEADHSQAASILQELQAEFLPERNQEGGGSNLGAHLDSLYIRATGISGPPLTDSFNFGSTIVNDYGRPFQQGANIDAGLSGEATAGPLAVYLREEYQHSPAGPASPLQAQQAVADQLEVPLNPTGPVAGVNRPRIIEGYASFAFHDLQFSFGKQSLWWGPTETGPLIWSTNAESIPMFRFSTTSPFKLPSILGWLGPMRTEFFLGQLDGQQYINTDAGTVGPHLRTQPFVHGLKVSFKLASSMELGFSRTVVFAGQGHPFTFASWWRSFTALNTKNSNDTLANDTGDRRVGFDFSYGVPYLRKYLTLYTDSFCEDDPSPLGNSPSRCAWSPGFYLSRFPGLAKLDLRAEGVDTDVSGFDQTGVNYTNFVYRNSYTNNRNVIGSWVGRAGRGWQVWSNYWLSPQSKIQAGYRHQGVDRDFLQGGWLDDISLNAQLNLRPGVALSAGAQFEKWNFPLLAPNTKSNLSLSWTLTYRPKWGWGVKP
jgi:membrane-associated phospholipid phosphatase